MTESENPENPDHGKEAPVPDGPLTPEEVEHDPAYEPDDEELKRVKGG